MTPSERLELLATARAGHCALQLTSECGEEKARAVLRGGIRAFVSAFVALDKEAARSLLEELRREHFVPDHVVKLRLVKSGEAHG